MAAGALLRIRSFTFGQLWLRGRRILASHERETQAESCDHDSVPHARFLLHGVSTGFQQNERLEEPQLHERLKGLQIDMQNIARVIAANTGKSESEVKTAMLERTTLNPEEAKAWGLVDEIKSELFESGAEIISIQSAT